MVFSSPNNQYYRIGAGVGSLSLMGEIELGQTIWDVYSYSMVVSDALRSKNMLFFEILKNIRGCMLGAKIWILCL